MLKEFAFQLAKRRGYEIRGSRSAFATQKAIAGVLHQQGINLVLDVGANGGQFASELREFGYKGRIISFEPLAAVHALLMERSKDDRNWTIAPRTALGAEPGSVDFHVSENSVCSSILDILPTIVEAEPRARYAGTESVPVNRLDDLCEFAPSDRVLLKVDVQGYEKQVLEGAERTLDRCTALVTELSFVPCYEGQAMAPELLDFLSSKGFEIWALEPVLHNPETFRLLQSDGVFVRSARS